MSNQSADRPKITVQTSWSGTHDAKPAVVISPQEGLQKLLPVSGTSPATTAASSGTVVMLCQEPKTTALLRQSLTEVEILLRQCFSLQAVLADQPPVGPACLVVDFDQRDMVDLKFFERLRTKGWRLPIIVLAENPAIRAVVQLMRLGAEDVLLKSTEADEISTAIQSALQHSRQQLQRCRRQYEVRRRLESLSRREIEIVKLILAGMLNKEIASRLSLSLVTVKVHRCSAMRKLGARNPAELARLTLASNGLNAMGMNSLESLTAEREELFAATDSVAG